MYQVELLFMPTYEEQLIEDNDFLFEELFTSDIESWFSADIACCDTCYADFLKTWPLAFNANDGEFQCNQIDLSSFYSGSKRCRQQYTEHEFTILFKNYPCPRCSNDLISNIWAYKLPFSYQVKPNEFEEDINSIAELSENTPFLLLSNYFANETFELLKKLAESTTSNKIEQTLYRARIATQIGELSFNQFLFPPKKFIQEGRYNHAGQQVLYAASDFDTCFREVRKALCYVAEFKISQNIKVLDLSDPEASHVKFAEELSALVFSSLMSRELDTEGYHKPCYVFSRFIADCAKLAGFDAIKYPSTKIVGKNFNIVFINEDIVNNSIEFIQMSLKDSNKTYAIEVDT